MVRMTPQVLGRSPGLAYISLTDAQSQHTAVFARLNLVGMTTGVPHLLQGRALSGNSFGPMNCWGGAVSIIRLVLL